MSFTLISSRTGTGTSDRFNIKKTELPATLCATGLAGSETVDIQISQDDGATFANTGVQLDATTNTKALTGPGIFKVVKSSTASKVLVNLTVNNNLYVMASQAPTLWTPADIVTYGWWDASDTSTITGSPSVSQIDDKSGEGNHLVQATGSLQMTTGTRTVNGLNVLDGDGTEYMDHLTFPVDASGDMMVFGMIVIDVVDSTKESAYSFDGASTEMQVHSNNAAQWDGQMQTSGIGANINFTGGPYMGQHLFNANLDFSGAGIYNAYMDGTKRTVDATYAVKLETPAALKLMANLSGAQKMEGAFAEMIITTDGSTDTRQKLEGYIMWKWGLEANLPSGHPYEFAAPTV